MLYDFCNFLREFKLILVWILLLEFWFVHMNRVSTQMFFTYCIGLSRKIIRFSSIFLKFSVRMIGYLNKNFRIDSIRMFSKLFQHEHVFIWMKDEHFWNLLHTHHILQMTRHTAGNFSHHKIALKNHIPHHPWSRDNSEHPIKFSHRLSTLQQVNYS